MKAEYISEEMDSSGFVVLADYIPGIIQEIRYHSTYNFIGDRIDGYEEPVALLTKEAARALKTVSNEMMVQGYRLKVYDAYRPARAFILILKSRNFLQKAILQRIPVTARGALLI